MEPSGWQAISTEAKHISVYSQHVNRFRSSADREISGCPHIWHVREFGNEDHELQV